MNDRAMWYGLAALFLAASLSHAGPVGPLTTFTAGTTARASEVNANFSAMKTAVDDNHSRITTLEAVNSAGRLTTLETTVTPAGNIVLVPSTPTAGNIFKGTAPFIHNFGPDNTFVGVDSGNFTLSGDHNTGIGVRSLRSNTIGGNNTAVGWEALMSNTDGGGNTAIGMLALTGNSGGSQNTAIGLVALLSNQTGENNTASGTNALSENTVGMRNTATGAFSLPNNTTGSGNIAMGESAGFNLTTGDDNIDIGNAGVAGESSTIRIGASQTRAFISGIRGITTGANDAIAVMVDSSGQLGTVSSSRRVKDGITDMDKASETLMQLRPVTFHYKSDKNPKGRTLQYGLVAEEVAEVAPGLVAHSADGKIETVYYQFLAPMLLNEVQKQQRTIEAQQAQLRQQTGRIAELEKQIVEIAELKQQTARIAVLLGRLERAERIAATAH